MLSILLIPAHSSLFQNILFFQLFIFEIKMYNVVNSWGKTVISLGLYQYFGTIDIFSFSRNRTYLPTYVSLEHLKFWCFLYKGHIHILNLFVSISHATRNEISLSLYFSNLILPAKNAVNFWISILNSSLNQLLLF